MLLDWTGRELRADERGAIPAHLARIALISPSSVPKNQHPNSHNHTTLSPTQSPKITAVVFVCDQFR